jgi:hypothetical protein
MTSADNTEHAQALRDLERAYGQKAAAGTILRDSDGSRILIRIGTAQARLGYPTPPSLTRRTVRGQRLYEATWLPSGNQARFTSKAGASLFLDAHGYAAGYLRITGTLPAWATE